MDKENCGENHHHRRRRGSCNNSSSDNNGYSRCSNDNDDGNDLDLFTISFRSPSNCDNDVGTPTHYVSPIIRSKHLDNDDEPLWHDDDDDSRFLERGDYDDDESAFLLPRVLQPLTAAAAAVSTPMKEESLPAATEESACRSEFATATITATTPTPTPTKQQQLLYASPNNNNRSNNNGLHHRLLHHRQQQQQHHHHHHHHHCATAPFNNKIIGSHSKDSKKKTKKKKSRLLLRRNHHDNNNNNNMSTLLYPANKTKNTSCCILPPFGRCNKSWLFLCAGITVVVYICLSWYTFLQLSTSFDVMTTTTTTTNNNKDSYFTTAVERTRRSGQQQQQQYYTVASSYLSFLGDAETNKLATARRRRIILEQLEADARIDAAKQAQQRAAARQKQTRPPPPPPPALRNNNSDNDDASPSLLLLPFLKPYEIESFRNNNDNEDDNENADNVKGDPQHEYRPAKLEELCGFHAQNASLTDPESYLARDALNPQTGARVLVTGVVANLPLGFHLALRLRERCGVEVMALDPALPGETDMEHRLKVTAQKLQILSGRKTQQQQNQKQNRQLPPVRVQNSYFGLDPKPSGHDRGASSSSKRHQHNMNSILADFSPTHVVHLAFAGHEVFRKQKKNDRSAPLHSPYVSESYDPALFQIRSTMTSMEQILTAMKRTNQQGQPTPHLTYASTNLLSQKKNSEPIRSGRRSGNEMLLHKQTRLMDELLANTYHSLDNRIYSVSMRLPKNIYGPWEHPCSDMYKVISDAVEGNLNSSNYYAAQSSSASALDAVYVDDVVDAMIAAMQYRSTDSKPKRFDISSGETLSEKDVSSLSLSLLSRNSTSSGPAGTAVAPRTRVQRKQGQTRPAPELSPHTPLKTGLARTIAWFLDQKLPFGPPSIDQHRKNNSLASPHPLLLPEAGDHFLQRHSLETCAADDLVCHSSRNFLPCASECSSRANCRASIFDGVLDVIQEVTAECDIVVYTQSLGVSVKELALHAEYQESGSPLVCNFAFVSRDSPLAQRVIQQVSNSDLAEFGVAPQPEDNAGGHNAIHERKLDKLNGRLLYKGWILVWPQQETPAQLETADTFLLKLSPGRLLHPSVQAAVYIEQNLLVSPKIQDILFLVEEMKRNARQERYIRLKEASLKATYRLPAEPPRRATMLLPQLKQRSSSYGDSGQKENDKLSVSEASKYMRYENGEDPLQKKEPTNIKVQREFYEQIGSMANRDYLRSPEERPYPYKMKQWPRTRWLVHDITLDESRQLRCEWYQEHVQWNTELDQLSFAHIMAKRDVLRRMAHQEPDDLDLKQTKRKRELKQFLTDSFEWHPLQTEQNRRNPDSYQIKKLPYDYSVPPGSAIDAPIEQKSEPNEEEIPLYVRIISERVLAQARKTWNDKLKSK